MTSGAFTLRGGTIVDGTGAAPCVGDVRVRDGRIVGVGELGHDPGAPDRDVSGLHIAPGFIDVHTHYDAQVLWDPELTPSSWHGVTTVVMGNCGFGVAPAPPEARDELCAVLQAVEDMPADALREGIDWSFVTFPDYLDRIERGRPRLNVLAYIGHTPLRISVMGPAAFDRAATPDELAAMCRTLSDACDAGALGLSSSLAPNHLTSDGRPVPSMVGGLDELEQLAGALPDGAVVTVARGRVPVEDLRSLVRPGISVTWSSVLTGRPGEATGPVDLVDQTAALGDRVFAQVSCRPLMLRVNLLDPVTLGVLPAFASVLALDKGDRIARYRDPAWRAAARSGLDDTWQAIWSTAVLLPDGEDDPALGRSLAGLGSGLAAFDETFDQLVSEQPAHRLALAIANTDEATLAELLNDPRVLLGLSDAGAHTDQLCDAGFATYLLGHWVRDRGAVPLETAVWLLTGRPAEFLGLSDRGVIRPDSVADLVVFDAATVAALPPERLHDLPGGGSRLVSRADGIVDTWVGGERL